VTRTHLAGFKRRLLCAVLLAIAGLESARAVETTQPCRIAGLRHSVQCGSVQRPLDPDRPGGPTIDIHYVVVPALARRKLPDPVFLLAGGPGQSAIALAGNTMGLFQRLGNRRDLVFVDQRGTGRSAPLICDEQRSLPLAEQADPKQQLLRLTACRNQLQRLAYGDLRFFTTTLAMQDLDAVRQKLGVGQINLVGASYGTRAALEYQRQFGPQVRRMVLDGVAPPDMVLPSSASPDAQAALDGLFAFCASQPVCAASHPRLREDWAALLASLPRSARLAHPLTGVLEDVHLSRDMVLAAVRAPLYSPALAAALPVAITEAAQGRFTALLGLSLPLSARKAQRIAEGMHFSVLCAEDYPRMDLVDAPAGADFGTSFARQLQSVCADWPRGKVPAAFYNIPVSQVPVLLLSGGLDPATPPRHAARVASALGPQARHLVVAQAGHGVLGIGCMRDVLYRFLAAEEDGEALAVDIQCIDAVPRPAAFQATTGPAR
jgi:pimeloyl-ACP methyl ester carboxylesterase